MIEDRDGIRTESLLADVDLRAGSPCASCSVPLRGHDVLAAVWLGFRDAPRCPRCVASGLGREPNEFLLHVRGALLRRDCFREAWEVVVDREGFDPCAADPTPATWMSSETAVAVPSQADAFVEKAADVVYDAGDLGCGDLVMELRLKLRAMKSGATLLLTALDPGAPEDIPAWCGLTGHRLLRAAHPEYLIRRKDD